MSNYSSLNQLNTDSSRSIVINRISRIIEKYNDVWRVFHEPIQNSIDAIQKRSDISSGIIDVEASISNDTIKIIDNGKGFPKDFNLLLPDGTDKNEQSDTMGYQGVGLKSVIYSSTSFKLLANTGDENWGISIKKASEYLNSGGDVIAPIELIEGHQIHQGTELQITFEKGTLIRAVEQILDSIMYSESNFKWRWDDVLNTNVFLSQVKDKSEIIKYIIQYYFLTQSYIGSVSRLLNCRLKKSEDVYAKQVVVKLSLDFSNCIPDGIENDYLIDYISELESQEKPKTKICVELINKFIDFGEIVLKYQEIKPRSISFEMYDFDIKRAGIENNPTLKDQIYCKIMTPDYSKQENDIEARYSQYISLLDSGSQQRKEKNIDKFKSLFPKILGVYILIGRMEYFEKYLGNNHGIKIIAANGIPTQHELTPRSTNQSFYFSPITFILNVDGKLNEGKTELISIHLKRQCVEFFREAFESTLNRLAKEFVRTVPNTDPPPPMPDFINEKCIKISGVDFTRFPQDENTLIALFYQLLKKKSLNLPTYGLLSQGIIDGKFTFEDKDVRSVNDLLSIEFKVELSKLINDFDSPNKPKEFEKCDLLVVWDDRLTSTQQKDWRLVNKDAMTTQNLYITNAPDWIEVYLKDRDHRYKPIIIVKEWVNELDAH